MKRNIHKRLEVLEKTSAAVQAQKPPTDGASAIQWVRDIVKACGEEQRPMESLHVTFARCLGMTPQELDNRMRAMAYPQ